MWQFIISGYIPGTDIQITFEVFATFSAVTFGFFTLWLLIRQYMKYRDYYNQYKDIDRFSGIAL